RPRRRRDARHELGRVHGVRGERDRQVDAGGKAGDAGELSQLLSQPARFLLALILRRAWFEARPRPEERAKRASRRARAGASPKGRASRRMRVASRFETHRSVVCLWEGMRLPHAAMLLSMRPGKGLRRCTATTP